MTHKSIRRYTTIFALTAAVTSAVAATATAAPVPTTLTLNTYSLPASGFCGAKIDVTVQPGATPESYVTVGPNVQYLGLGPCDLTAMLEWLEISSGRTGSESIPVTNGLVNYGQKTFSGHGPVQYTLTTNGPHTTDRTTGTVLIP